ncbi:MAG: 4-hydroxy-3-methylbut-2-enyl diphosphate reductase [Flavobacteriia bacterium]|nr:4-hydroxy-3-methylbut-2-enyl diphosphate reductase [Flavobacteriia bacterium]
MKTFDVPSFYRSPIISRVKAKRKIQDPRKQDFSPSVLHFNKVSFHLARHFGFCYGVENAIEKSYNALKENIGKRIYLLSQMIHNPAVNDDLTKNGIAFLQDTDGQQLISFESLTAEDIVIIPAFGTTLEIENRLKSIGCDIQTYNTTCPFVEKVWNRSGKLGSQGHTIIIHGKAEHEETRATFSRSAANSPSLVIKDIEEAIYLGKIISGDLEEANFYSFFEGKYTANFNPKVDLARIGVVNQTTMLASETESITAYIRSVMIEKYGLENIKNHMADTRDTLCYATNDNQTATLSLMEKTHDLAIVVGGYNSSNTTHLVEILETKFPTYFIKDESEIISKNEIHSFNIHQKFVEQRPSFLPNLPHVNIAITSGASCPDRLVDEVIQRILTLCEEDKSIEDALLDL